MSISSDKIVKVAVSFIWLQFITSNLRFVFVVGWLFFTQGRVISAGRLQVEWQVHQRLIAALAALQTATGRYMCPARIWFLSDSNSERKMNSTSGSGALIWPRRNTVKEWRARVALEKWSSRGLLLINASHYPSSVSHAAGRPISSTVRDISGSSADNWPWWFTPSLSLAPLKQ